MNETLDLSVYQIGLAGLLVLVNGALSILLRLELEKKILIAAARMTVQLFIVGLILDSIFAINQIWQVAIMMIFMTTIASSTAVDRQGRRYRGLRLDCTISTFLSTWVIGGVALMWVVQAEPWYAPRYAIPIMGMILGNALNGITLGLERFTQELSRREEIETILALGGSRWEAARPVVKEAINASILPTLNSMTVCGIVSLPGMMTGQMLGGVSPFVAVKYQIVVMFLISASTFFTVGLTMMAAYFRLFESSHICRFDKIAQPRRISA